jgi:hypothetical protein
MITASPLVSRVSRSVFLALALGMASSVANANCDALIDFKELKPGRVPAVIKVPSETLGAPRRTIIDSVLGTGTERRVVVGESIARLEPRINSLDAKVSPGLILFTVDVFPFPTKSQNDLIRNPTVEETFDLVDGRGSFALFRLPYQSAEYQSVKRYFVVDETGTICKPYLEDANWTVMKRGIRESSVPSVQLARIDKPLPQQVLALARVGTTIDVEWREVTAGGNSQLKSKRSLDRSVRGPILIGPFQFEIKSVEADTITITELPARLHGW